MSEAGKDPQLLVVAVATMLSTYALVIMSSMTLPVLAPVAAETIGVPARNIGIYTAILYCGAALSSLVAPHLITRFGSLRTSQGTVVLAALGLFALASGAIPLVVLSALLIGLAYGPGNTASNRLLTTLTAPGKRSGVFSIKQTSVPIGGAIAGLVVPPLALQWGWQGAAVAMGLVCLACAIAVQPWRAPLDTDRDPAHQIVPANPATPVAFVMSHARLRAIAVTGLVYSGMQYAFGAIMVAFFVERAGIGAVEAGLVLSAAMIASVVFRLAWGYIADLTDPAAVMGLIGLLTAGSVVTAIFVDPRWSIPALVGLGCWFGAAGFSWNGVFLALIADVAGTKNVSTATSGAMTMVFIGSLSFPAAFTGLLVLSGYELALAGVAAVTALTAVYAWLQLRKP